MKKYSSREKRLLRFMIAAIAIGAFVEVYDRFDKKKQDMLLRIESEKTAQDVYWQKLEVDEEKLIADIERFNDVLSDAEDRVLMMPNESDASFKVQEFLAKVGEKAQIGMNSQNKRKSEVVSEDKGILELRTYFGYDCSLEEMLQFFDMLREQPYYYGLDTLNINSYSRRRSRRPSKEEDPNIDRIRGSMVISTLYSAGEGTFEFVELEPRPRITPEISEEEMGEEVTDIEGEEPVVSKREPAKNLSPCPLYANKSCPSVINRVKLAAHRLFRTMDGCLLLKTSD